MENLPVVTTPSDLLRIAVEKEADLDKLTKLMDLQDRWEQREARKAYVLAMAEFKKNPPEIEKDKSVSYGNTSYDYATLANVTRKINMGLGAHGLSSGWITEQSADVISITCTITHAMGHSESTTLTAAPDTSGSKNSIQAIGSTISYLQRYTLLALTGLATFESDDDGQSAEIKHITEDQANELHAMINDNKLNHDGKYLPLFLKYIKAESIETIRASDFLKAKSGINAALAKVKK